MAMAMAMAMAMLSCYGNASSTRDKALRNGGRAVMASGSSSAVTPKISIRRFDVFAEYNRLKGLEKGLDEPHAKGYGLWVAKVVASGGGRQAGSQSSQQQPAGGAGEGPAGHEVPGRQEWHELSGEPQTDVLFDREIIRRMGQDFYMQVFAPAIAQAVQEHRSYESIRDTIRTGWKPAH